MIRQRYLIAAAVIIPCILLAALYFIGYWIPNYPDPKEYPLRGMDVSGHQGSIDWRQVAQSGIHFVYIKASEGADFKDARFNENLQGAKRSGLICGAYHFFSFKSSGEAQAQNFLQTIPQNERITLPPAIDLEFWGNSSVRPPVQEFQTELRHFLDRVRYGTGREPVIYTSPDFRKAYLQGLTINRFWVPEFVFRPNSGASNECLFWQFTERGHVPGINGFVDLDVFRGNAEEFESLVNGGSVGTIPH